MLFVSSLGSKGERKRVLLLEEEEACSVDPFKIGGKKETSFLAPLFISCCLKDHHMRDLLRCAKKKESIIRFLAIVSSL